MISIRKWKKIQLSFEIRLLKQDKNKGKKAYTLYLLILILHLQVDLKTAIRWAEQNQIKWAFSDRNAGTYFVSFYNDIIDMIEINWEAVKATDFRDSLIKEGKQAEFLLHDICAWQIVEKIGGVESENA